MTARMRADRLLVKRGLFESRAKAQAAIAAGLVTADDAPVAKASDEIAADARLAAEQAYPFVSRGGVKLAAALDHFRFDPAGRIALDVGASTGGFTEVLLARGARRVYAVDVGHGQLHTSLRARHELLVIENTDIRALAPARLTEPPDLVVGQIQVDDLSLSALTIQPDGKLVVAVDVRLRPCRDRPSWGRSRPAGRRTDSRAWRAG